MANPNILNVNINNVLSNWPFNATKGINQGTKICPGLTMVWNPDGHPIHSPNNYDIRFFNELSDEFWLQTSIGNDAGVVPEAVAAAAVAAAAAAATAIGGGEEEIEEEEIEEEEIGIKVNTN
ncbi:unnamed protein product [Rhizophagus irregularis]|nr:unnamed protein product [Rhizophagus irregularis]